MKNIIFVAAPASGKALFSKMLEEKLGYKHLSIGDILREKVNDGDETIKNLINNGKLVSDEIISNILIEKIKVLKDKPFILDGCPRTLNQAKMLDRLLNEENITNIVVLKLDVTLETIKKRILGRYVCVCGRSYNINDEKFKPQIPGICDSCQKSLFKREDDTSEKVETRYNDFVKNISPIEEFYKEKNIFYSINVETDLDEVFEKMKEKLNDLN